MVRANLKANSGIVLYPSGLNVEYFEAGVMRGIGGMLRGKIGDLRDGETKSWRGELWAGNRWRWRWGFGLSRCRWHASKESGPKD